MIYERFKELCERNNTSPTAICEKITGSKGNLATWKKGSVRSDDLNKIADYLDVDVNYLLGRTDTPPRYSKSPNQRKARISHLRTATTQRKRWR